MLASKVSLCLTQLQMNCVSSTMLSAIRIVCVAYSRRYTDNIRFLTVGKTKDVFSHTQLERYGLWTCLIGCELREEIVLKSIGDMNVSHWSCSCELTEGEHYLTLYNAALLLQEHTSRISDSNIWLLATDGHRKLLQFAINWQLIEEQLVTRCRSSV